MSLFGMVCLAREKCENFRKQRESCKGGVGSILLLFIFVVSCTKAFRGFPLSVLQLDWVVVCNSSP